MILPTESYLLTYLLHALPHATIQNYVQMDAETSSRLVVFDEARICDICLFRTIHFSTIEHVI